MCACVCQFFIYFPILFSFICVAAHHDKGIWGHFACWAGLSRAFCQLSGTEATVRRINAFKQQESQKPRADPGCKMKGSGRGANLNNLTQNKNSPDGQSGRTSPKQGTQQSERLYLSKHFTRVTRTDAAFMGSLRLTSPTLLNADKPVIWMHRFTLGFQTPTRSLPL